MSRWSQTYKMRSGSYANIDNMDIIGGQQPERGHNVNNVNIVTPRPALDRHANIADDAIERAAIQAEALPVRRLHKRMVSWANMNDNPMPGDFCGCCFGALWWTAAPKANGWCCARCHPPAHLEAGQYEVRAT